MNRQDTDGKKILENLSLQKGLVPKNILPKKKKKKQLLKFDSKKTQNNPTRK